MIYLAPLQGFTDFVFRKTYSEVFGAVDKYFIPYIVVKNNAVPRKHVQEIWPENNPLTATIPQVLAKNSGELIYLAEYLSTYGYREINLNLGCPYPMVTRRGRGSGLLPFPEKIEKMLASFFEKTNLSLSVKIRSGLENEHEIEKVIPVLNQFPLTEIILHARTASQLYKGKISEDIFSWALKNTNKPLVYNGDIFSISDFNKKHLKFEGVENWMLGRGILKNLFLPFEINQKFILQTEKYEMLEKMHSMVFEAYSVQSDNAGNVLNKMKQFWKYFSFHFENQRKTHKRIKKIKNPKLYQAEIKTIFSERRFG